MINELTTNNATPISKQEAISIKEINGEPVMSSLRIAEITDKQHKHVIRDIEAILKELEIGESRFGLSYLSPQNKPLKAYLLPEREFNLVISGYSIKYRATLIDELMSYRKNKVEPKLTPIQLMEKANALLLEENEKNKSYLRAKRRLLIQWK